MTEVFVSVIITPLCLQMMFLAYLFFLVWLGVTAFTSLPVFMYFNVWSMCKNTSLVEGANLCLDLRQFGTLFTCTAGIMSLFLNRFIIYIYF